MRDPILREVKKFLEQHWVAGKPLLLGYSGGPDSKALLYSLLACRRFFSLELQVAHVDHGWRATSGQEAEALKKEVVALELPFHLCTLSSGEFEPGNWEEQGRLKRLSFFSSLYRQLGCQAVLLGHQAEDLAETVLKRLFEGAHLHALGGFTASSSYEEMQIWRPLLKISKESLIRWLEGKGLSYVVDPTNESHQFLRGRMRTEILPFLNQSFGKNISKNLRHLAEEAERLKDFFAHLNQSLFESLELATRPLELDLKLHLPLHPLQLKFLLRSWIESHGIYVSREMLSGMIDSLLEKGGKKVFEMKSAKFVVSRNKIAISF